jgi:hypothetical protein
MADTARGKQVRCASCKAVFVAGSTANNGNPPAPKPSVSAVKPAAPASKPAAKSKAVTPNTRPKTAPVVLEVADDDPPPEKKKKKSILPYFLIGCGALFLLCGGGSIGGYVAYTKFIKIKDEATESFNQFQAELDKAAAEQKRRQEETRKRVEVQVKPNNPDPNRPPDQNPNNAANPPAQPPQSAVVQSVALSIPLNAKPQEVFNVLWTGMDGKQAVALVRADKMLRLEQYDLTNGQKLGSMDTLFEAATYVRDFSPDGNYYVCNHPGTPYSIWAMPNPKAIVDKWLPPPVQNESMGVANTAVSAYLLNGPRVLTVNGAGQVAVWSIPTAAGEKPTQQMSYVPPTSVAKYPLGLAPERTALSPDRTRLAVFNGSDGFFLLNTATLQLEGSVNSPEDAQPEKAAISNTIGPVFSPDGKYLAVRFHLPSGRGSKGGSPQLVRWDVQTRQRTARFADPSKGAASRIGWWGNDFFWVARNNGSSALISWEKQSVVLRAALRRTEKVCLGNTDGKCWFLATGPDGNAVLKGIDLPAAALQQAAQPLKLTGDGIVSP